MRILFISAELIGSALIHKLINERHDVKLYIEHEDRKPCLEGFVSKVNDWREELDWVGKDGLIIFDDVVFAGVQDDLRKKGYSVVGGDSLSDKLELERSFFSDISKSSGLQVLPAYDFSSADEAIRFVKENIDTWVVKQNNHISSLNYVGQRSDAQDVLNILETYKEKNISPIHLQKKVSGVEIGVARYFNGNDWVGPIELNIEHKALFNDDIGPLTAEMGTVIWYEDDENLPIFKQTLHKLKKYLQEIRYKGDIDVNCIVNDDGVWPLEATMRFGTPSTQAQSELHKSPWGDFLKAVADGSEFNLEYRKGYSVVVSVAMPPFPYGPENFSGSNIQTSEGTNIFFTPDITLDDMNHIHFEEVSIKTKDSGEKSYHITGKHGYTLYVTGNGDTVEEAQQKVYGVIKKIIIPKMFYRTDIGNKFISADRARLKELKLI